MNNKIHKDSELKDLICISTLGIIVALIGFRVQYLKPEWVLHSYKAQMTIKAFGVRGFDAIVYTGIFFFILCQCKIFFDSVVGLKINKQQLEERRKVN